MSPRESIAHYRIVSKLDEVGMWPGYRVTDTKLKREVAIKGLPEAFAADRVGIARFAREAHVLASLNHHNIAVIDGIEQGGVVMELGAKLGLQVSEPNLTRYDLFCGDECFLTGTGAEIVPVTKIDGRVINDGKPGPLTRKMVEQYHALTKMSGEPIYD